MKNQTIAYITLPALLLMSSLSIVNVNADTNNLAEGEESSEGKQHRGQKHARKSQKKFAMLTEKLELSESQQTQIKALFEAQQAARQSSGNGRKALHQAIRNLDVNAADYTEKLAAIKQQAGLAAGGKIDAMMAMQQSMQKILSAEQFEKLQTLKSDKRGQHND